MMGPKRDEARFAISGGRYHEGKAMRDARVQRLIEARSAEVVGIDGGDADFCAHDGAAGGCGRCCRCGCFRGILFTESPLSLFFRLRHSASPSPLRVSLCLRKALLIPFAFLASSHDESYYLPSHYPKGAFVFARFLLA